MRGLFLTAVVTLSTVTLAAAPAKSFAVGGGDQVYSSGSKHFSISAHNGPNGASGHVVFTQQDASFGDFTLSGHVSCVSVVGNLATIGVTIEHGTGTATGQPGIHIYVTDNGNGGSGTPDSFTNGGYEVVGSVCPPPFDAATPITSGNINVK
jgi:hypothetical protein